MNILKVRLTKSRIIGVIIWLIFFIARIIIGPYVKDYLDTKYKFGLIMDFIINHFQLITGILLVVILIGVLIWWYIRDNIIQRIKDTELLARYCAVTIKSYNYSPHNNQMGMNFTPKEINRIAVLIKDIKEPVSRI